MNESMLALLTLLCLRSARSIATEPQRWIWRRWSPRRSDRDRQAHLPDRVGPSVGLFVERFGARALLRWELWTTGIL